MTESHDIGDGPIWTRPEPSARSLRFSRQQIAAAALEIADAEGFDAVSMRRIARSLGAGTMSLYRYIATKDDLLALIGDALLGEALVPGELPADWLDAIAAVARETRRAYLRHPWAIRLVQREGAVQAALAGPNGLRHVEQSLSALSGAPMNARAKLDVLAIVDDYVFGHLMRSASTPDPEPAGIDDFVRSQLASGSFPQLATAMTPIDVASFAGADQEARFELGLSMLLDGIAARYH
ncbi:MAG TPA: TetR/AcrR family transcriptional regulator [Streptosporangiaceae bacterium]|nr:TetR/AcrR family transcriptional regulator [Streptosporangiaceae bacterium]